MILKIRLLFALLVCFSARLSSQPLPSVSGNDVWIAKNIQWRNAPRIINPNLSSAVTIVLYFKRDGRFGMMVCRLNKGPNYVVVSHGDGQVISEGTWRVESGGIRIHYRLISEAIPRIPPTSLPGPDQTELLEQTSRRELKLGKRIFVPFGDRLRATELEPEYFRFQVSGEQ